MHSPHEDRPEDDFPDLTAVTQYMTRHSLGRLNLTIEAVEVKEEELGEPRSTLLLVEDFSFNEAQLDPSPDGLAGVFIVVLDSAEGDGDLPPKK